MTQDTEAAFGPVGDNLPKPVERTPEEQAAWDAEDAVLCKKYGCSPGWGHHYHRLANGGHSAPPVGSTIDPGPR